MSIRITIPVFVTILAAVVQAADPVVSNVRAERDAGTKRVLIYYDVADTDGDRLVVSVAITVAEVSISAGAFTGDVGAGVTPGKSRRIAWDAGVDWNQQFSSAVRFTVTADDGMVLIPSGSFQMGDSFGDGSCDEIPVHTVYVSAFYMDKTEVTWAKWMEIRTWAAANGYDIGSIGMGKADSHPVYSVNWYECVKWCNARSQKEGMTPCYTRGGITYKSGVHDDITCDWSVAGYRLPTEAEWEKAARGGLSGKRFPCGDVITQRRGNYYSYWSGGKPYYLYDLNGTSGYHSTYNDGTLPFTSPAGVFAASGYELYDMDGNVNEWCWDWYGSTYYSGSQGNDPRGQPIASDRVTRGGSWIVNARLCRVACRFKNLPSLGSGNLGFRAVRRAP